MTNQWKWVLGIALVLLVLLVPAFAWRFFLSFDGYGMMSNASVWRMPMMYGSPGIMGFGMMFLMWGNCLATLVLIGLGIALFAKVIHAPK